MLRLGLCERPSAPGSGPGAVKKHLANEGFVLVKRCEAVLAQPRDEPDRIALLTHPIVAEANTCLQQLVVSSAARHILLRRFVGIRHGLSCHCWYNGQHYYCC